MSDTNKSAEEFYQLGNEFYEKEAYRQAIVYYEKAIKKAPTWFKPYYNKSLCHACSEHYSTALRGLQKVLELKPDYAEAYYIIGLCYEYSKKRDEAKDNYRKALELDPELTDAKDRLALLEQNKSLPKTKIDSCADYKISSGDLLEEIKELEKKGQHLEALTIAKQGLQDQPDNIHLLLQKRILEKKIEGSKKQYVVVGLNELKDTAEKLIIFPLRFAKNPLYRVPIAKTSKGFLIFGPPGCGKTVFIKSLAQTAGLTLIEVILSDVLNLYYGESEKRLKEVITKAKDTAQNGIPVLLFIDEVDAIGFARGMTPDPTEAAHDRHFITTFLNLLDEIHEIPNIIVVGATNRPWCVDEALKRPGRLGSAILYVSPPDEPARKELFKVYSEGTPGHQHLDFDTLARLTPWFSGDDIRGLCRDVHFEVARAILNGKKRRRAETQDFMKCIKDKNLQTVSWLRQVMIFFDQGKIDSKEIDQKLLEDIERFRFFPDRDTRRDDDSSYIG